VPAAEGRAIFILAVDVIRSIGRAAPVRRRGTAELEAEEECRGILLICSIRRAPVDLSEPAANRPILRPAHADGRALRVAFLRALLPCSNERRCRRCRRCGLSRLCGARLLGCLPSPTPRRSASRLLLFLPDGCEYNGRSTRRVRAPIPVSSSFARASAFLPRRWSASRSSAQVLRGSVRPASPSFSPRDASQFVAAPTVRPAQLRRVHGK
jgi:hypothetical protein